MGFFTKVTMSKPCEGLTKDPLVLSDLKVKEDYETSRGGKPCKDPVLGTEC